MTCWMFCSSQKPHGIGDAIRRLLPTRLPEGADRPNSHPFCTAVQASHCVAVEASASRHRTLHNTAGAAAATNAALLPSGFKKARQRRLAGTVSTVRAAESL